jgi:hypothetical protein
VVVSMVEEWSWVMNGAYGEDPLERCGHSPTPLVVALVVCVGDAGNDDASNGPAHLQRCGTGAPQRQWDDLRGISRRVCDEEAPWDTFERLSDDEDFERIGLDVVSKDVGISKIARLTKKVMKIVAFIMNRASSVVHR